MGYDKNKRGERRERGGGVKDSDILETHNMFDFKRAETANKHELMNEVLDTYNDFNDEYGLHLTEIQLAKLVKGSTALGYYDSEGNIAINEAYFSKAMVNAYDACVKSGYHPSRGNKTAMQAVMSHEIGHSMNDQIAAKFGTTMENAAKRICNEARRTTKDRGNVKLAARISRYATTNHAETLAEAVSDVYCNGSKASSASRAIVDTMRRYLK